MLVFLKIQIYIVFCFKKSALMRAVLSCPWASQCKIFYLCYTVARKTNGFQHKSIMKCDLHQCDKYQ